MENKIISNSYGSVSQLDTNSCDQNLEQELIQGSSYSEQHEILYQEKHLAEFKTKTDSSIKSDTKGHYKMSKGKKATSFLHFFIASAGPKQMVFLSMLYALALGSTVGVVPAVMTDQYAKIYHNFNSFGNEDNFNSCADYAKGDKPQACLDGSSDAQTFAASASFVSNMLTFFTSSLIGSISDDYGRRFFLILGQFLSMFGPFCLVIIQMFPSTNPNWYYAAHAMGGLINWMSISLSSISDVMPKEWRAPVFGIQLSGFSLGFALSPVFAIGLTHFGVSVLSLLLLFGGFLFSVWFLPETLPVATRMSARSQKRKYTREDNESKLEWILRALRRPINELSILNRNKLIRLLSALAFFSGMSTAADHTLLIYYVQDHLNFNDHDIAFMFGLIGLLGIFVQGVLLKPITDLIGERLVVVLSFICGAFSNAMYAFAPSKYVIFGAVCVSTFSNMAFPTISAIKSNNVEEFEQGRIQGALYAVNSLASAIGPCLLRLAYQVTRNTEYPGSFFLVATAFFSFAAVFGFILPKEKANSLLR